MYSDNPPVDFSSLAQMQAKRAKAQRREELAKALLLKIVENTGGVHPFDVSTNVRAAIAYTDKLLEALEKNDATDIHPH